ncbi:Planctomycete cytochrome C [Crateriforma conspicua]|nr:Planctomycete cytochrome C [Crateriforma conspicua]
MVPVTFLTLTLVSDRAIGVEPPDSISVFQQDYCLDCHQGPDAEAGLDLETLSADLDDQEAFARWVRVVDRVRDGEMPPEDYGAADPDDAKRFLKQASRWLADHQTRQDDSLGRVRGRRLTNRQLEKTLQDLLVIRTPLAPLMSGEPRLHGYVGIADAQPMSPYQLQTHLDVVDVALDAAFQKVSRTEPLLERQWDAAGIARKNPRRRCREPEMRQGRAVVWSCNMPFYGRMEATRVPRSGWYDIRFTASAVKPPSEGGVWCTVRRGECVSNSPLMTWIGSFEAESEPRTLEYRAWIPKGEKLEIRPNDSTLKRARFAGGQVGTGEGEPQNVPGLALSELSMREVQPAGSAADTAAVLFGDLAIAKHGRDGVVSFQVDPSATRQQLSDQLVRFAQLAFRRDIEPDRLVGFQQMLSQQLDEGVPAVDALRATYRAVLCSPRFLYFSEPVGRLDDFAIASRLSYFLCQSMPDQELLEAARRGQLHNPQTLIRQAHRLLDTPRGRSFMSDFADQWLELDQITDTEPDRRRFSEFDPIVQDAMLAETRAFLNQLLKDNAPVQQIVAADFTFLNSRLARYYGIDDVAGDQLRLVHLPDDSVRGGLMAHGSVLKVTANGTDTSPVLRGVWLCDRILGTPIPPPPSNVPAIEPDTRGSTSIREMLIRHEEDPNCAGCHRKIDAAGFALESFDASGQFRTRYERGNSRNKGPAVDPSGTLPGGDEFDDFTEFRHLVSHEDHRLAENLADHWITYGTGQRVRFADRARVESIVQRTADSQYAINDLLMAVITSPLFLEK